MVGIGLDDTAAGFYDSHCQLENEGDPRSGIAFFIQETRVVTFVEIGVLLVMFVLSVFSACAETAFFAMNRYSMKGLAAQGNYRAKLVLALMKRPEQILATILFLNTLANVCIAALASSLVADLVLETHREMALVLVTVVLTIGLLIFAELTPKTIAVHHADQLALWLIQPLRVMMALSRPIVKGGSALASQVARLLGHADSSDVKLSDAILRTLIDERATTASASDRDQMLHGVLSLSDLAVKAVTIPRPEVTALPLDAPAEEVFQTIRTSGYSRIPVYRDNIDNIVGILHSKDVLPLLMERLQDSGRTKEPLRLVHVMRKPLFVPDIAKVDATLKYMQKNHIHLAIVIDEHGGMEGIVTLEDLLEQIVGEIQDEHDFELDAIRRAPDGTQIIDADISIRELNKRLKLNLPESGHYSTLAGYLMALAGRILKEGEVVTTEAWKFSVLGTEGRRLVKIRMESLPAGSSADSGGSTGPKSGAAIAAASRTLNRR